MKLNTLPKNKKQKKPIYTKQGAETTLTWKASKTTTKACLLFMLSAKARKKTKKQKTKNLYEKKMKTKIKGKLLGTCLPLAVAYAIHLAPYPYAICALYAYLSMARCLSECVPHPATSIRTHTHAHSLTETWNCALGHICWLARLA